MLQRYAIIGNNIVTIIIIIRDAGFFVLKKRRGGCGHSALNPVENNNKESKRLLREYGLVRTEEGMKDERQGKHTAYTHRTEE